MKMTFELNKGIVCRYAEVACKMTGDKVDIEKEIWDKELYKDIKAGPFKIWAWETFNEGVDGKGKTIHATVGINDDYIYDLIDVVDKHSDSIKKIVTGVVSIIQGVSSLFSGLEKDVDALNKKYRVTEVCSQGYKEKEDDEMVG